MPLELRSSESSPVRLDSGLRECHEESLPIAVMTETARAPGQVGVAR